MRLRFPLETQVAFLHGALLNWIAASVFVDNVEYFTMLPVLHMHMPYERAWNL